MIQITTNATVGIRTGGRVTPKTAADGPFSTDPATEAMLVAEGHAAYADPDAQAAGTTTPPAQPAADYKKMRKPQLLAIAAERGLYSGDPDDITVPKLLELLKTSDNPPSDGQTAGDSTGKPENEGEAATGDESGQSGENGPEAPDSDPENAENGTDGDENGDSGDENGDSGSDDDPESAPPVIDAAGVVE